MTTEGDRLSKESAELTEQLPTQRLAQEAKSLLEAFAERVLASVGDKVSDKVNEFSHGLLEKVGGENGGGPGVKAAVAGLTALTEGKGPMRAALGAGATGLKEKIKGFFGGGRGKKGMKVTNIVETLDVGVPLRLAYDQWTQYEDFPTFMKKLEHVERPEEDKSNWKAQVFWSHRSWEANVLEQVPDDHIVWRAKGAKGYVDGAVSFSELAPNLTRICLVLEYHPQGLFEHTGNLWRAQGRRARLEFKHFRRHVMAHAILKPDEIEGWRGEVRDGEVVKTHEEALEEEERARAEEPRGREEEEPERRPEEPGEEVAEAREEEEEPEEGERPEEEPREAAEAEAEEAEAEEAEAEEGEAEEAEAEEGEAEEAEAEEGEREEAEGEEPEEPEEPEEYEEPEEPPRRPRRRPVAVGERPRPRPVRRRPPEGEERPRRPVRRRPAAGEEEEPPPPPRRPRRPAPPRGRGDEPE